MIALGALENVKREYLEESVAILKSANLITTQLSMLSGFAEKGLNVGKDVLSAGLKTIGGWGKDLTKNEGILGDLGKILSPLKETGEKWEKEQIRLSKDLMNKFKEEKKLAEKFSDEGLREVFLNEIKKVSEFAGKATDTEEFSEFLVNEIARLYEVNVESLPAEEVTKRSFDAFLKELLKNLKEGLSKIKEDEEMTKLFEEELIHLNDNQKESLQESIGIESVDYSVLKDYFEKLNLEEEEYEINNKAYGIYLASNLLMRSVSRLSGAVYPFATLSVLTSFLAFIISPIGGLLIASGIFAFLEFNGSKSFNRRMIAFILIPMWLDEKFGDTIITQIGE